MPVKALQIQNAGGYKGQKISLQLKTYIITGPLNPGVGSFYHSFIPRLVGY